MAHHLNYYFPAGDLAAEDVLTNILTVLIDAGFEGPELDDQASGGGAVLGTLLVAGADTGILLRAHTGDRNGDSQWEFLRDLPGAPPEVDASGALDVTLSGEVDWDVFRTVQRYLKADLGAAEYDEISGFSER